MIARTGYVVSVGSYLFFLTLDWLRPGFVSDYLSAHLFLGAAFIFGILWARKATTPGGGRLLTVCFLLPLGLLLAVFAWKEGRPFGDLRLLVSLIAFVVPFLTYARLSFLQDRGR